LLGFTENVTEFYRFFQTFLGGYSHITNYFTRCYYNIKLYYD